MKWAAAQPAHAADRLRRARSELFWRFPMQRASAAADAQAVSPLPSTPVPTSPFLVGRTLVYLDRDDQR